MISQQQDSAKFSKIYSEYGNSLLRMCFLYLKDYQLAEDAVQDTFIKVYTNYNSFRGECSEKTWVMKIAINTCKNYLRSNWRKKVDLNLLENIPSNEKDEYFDDVLTFVMNLPAKYKEVILLHYYQELKIHEISEVLNIPQSTVTTRLKRAKERLKSNLKGEYFYE